MIKEERRSYVRGNFSFKVKFKTMSPDEYEDIKRSNEAIFSHFNEEPIVDVDTKLSAVHKVDSSLINYLVHIDEKLDLILELLTKDNNMEGLMVQGMGHNISGSGMKILVDKPFKSGQIIHTKLYLSKVPLVFMDMFGEIIRVTKLDEDGKTLYSLGVKFLDLAVNDRERIIASIFQRERGAIRKRKSKS